LGETLKQSLIFQHEENPTATILAAVTLLAFVGIVGRQGALLVHVAENTQGARRVFGDADLGMVGLLSLIALQA
jgi:hypothetical protein